MFLLFVVGSPGACWFEVAKGVGPDQEGGTRSGRMAICPQWQGWPSGGPLTTLTETGEITTPTTSKWLQGTSTF